MNDTIVEVGIEYGDEYAGVYRVRILSWKEGRELIRKAIKAKDPTGYIEELVVASVTGPKGKLEALDTFPSGLVRRLMDETLKLNDINRPESTFL